MADTTQQYTIGSSTYTVKRREAKLGRLQAIGSDSFAVPLLIKHGDPLRGREIPLINPSPATLNLLLRMIGNACFYGVELLFTPQNLLAGVRASGSDEMVFMLPVS